MVGLREGLVWYMEETPIMEEEQAMADGIRWGRITEGQGDE